MTRFVAITFAWICVGFLPSVQGAILASPFGASGQGGSRNGQTLLFGITGSVFELDAFVSIGGLDLNGDSLGTSAQLSIDPLPPGLSFQFGTSLSADGTDLTLRYCFTNSTAFVLSDVWFFVFVDAEIDVATNTYFNETGEILGVAGNGPGDVDPDSFEIDEPGYVFGNIFQNLLLGTLDNSNALPSTYPDDVSLALGFSLGPILPEYTATITILLSEDGDSIGSLALHHFDTDPSSTDILTISGQASVTAVPEPPSLILMGTALTTSLGWLLNRRIARGRGRVVPSRRDSKQ